MQLSLFNVLIYDGLQFCLKIKNPAKTGFLTH